MQKELIQLLNMQDTGYQIDSRLIKKNDIFFALKGERVDGHLFLDEALKKGAKIAVVEKEAKVQVAGLELIRVEGVLRILQELARESLMRSRAKIVGITGSFGKTIVKEFLYSLVEGNLEASKSCKNYNSQRGLPIAILNMNRDVDVLMLEMAMDEMGEIKKLVDMAIPDIALITKIGFFQESFKSVEDVAKAKNEIFSNEKTKVKIINKELLKFKAFKGEYLTYSIEDQTADFYLDIKNKDFYEEGKKSNLDFLPFEESHLLENLLASISVARILKIDLMKIIENFQNLKMPSMRFEKIWIGKNLFIKDCYNANFETTIAALKNIPNVKGKKIAVLGSLPHLNNIDKNAHKKIIAEAKKRVDHILCMGDEWKDIENVTVFETHESLVEELNKIMKKNDVILVKGSRNMKMEKIFDFYN